MPRLTEALGNSSVHVFAQHDAVTDKHRLRIERRHHGNAKVIELLKKCGVNVIEFCGVHLDFTKEELFEPCVELYKKNGVRIDSIGVPTSTVRMPMRAALTAEARRQRVALQVLHDQEVPPVVLADVEQGADVGVVEGRQQLRLALEAREALGIGDERRGQDLDRDVAIELGVARTIHLAHSACPERAEDFV